MRSIISPGSSPFHLEVEMTPVRIPPRSFLVVANGQKWGTGVKCTSSQSEIQYRLYIWRTTGKSVVNKPKKNEWLQMCKKKMQTICFCGAGVGSSYMASKIVLYDVWGVLKGNLCPIRGSKMGQEVGAKQRIVEMLKKKKHGKKTLKKKKPLANQTKCLSAKDIWMLSWSFWAIESKNDIRFFELAWHYEIFYFGQWTNWFLMCFDRLQNVFWSFVLWRHLILRFKDCYY